MFFTHILHKKHWVCNLLDFKLWTVSRIQNFQPMIQAYLGPGETPLTVSLQRFQILGVFRVFQELHVAGKIACHEAPGGTMYVDPT